MYIGRKACEGDGSLFFSSPFVHMKGEVNLPRPVGESEANYVRAHHYGTVNFAFVHLQNVDYGC